MVVRSLIHKMGFRYRLHQKDLPGCPDIVFRNQKKVIFVNGCFWHQHQGCKRAKKPKTRKKFWYNKLAKNVERDKDNLLELEKMGWDVLVIWECKLKNENLLKKTCYTFLNN